MSVPPERWTADGIYLALETSGPTGSVAVARGAEVLARAFLLEPGEQSSALVPAIQQVLEQAGLSKAALRGVVVGAGPGSFTGVRIAAATAKGLTHALELPMWPFSSLAAGALSDLVLPPGAGPRGFREERHGEPPPVRWVLFDARGDRVYAACYRATREALEELVPAHPTTIGELLAAPRSDAAFSGDGAVRHRALIAEAGHPVIDPPAGVPTADALVRLFSLRRNERPISDIARWEPEYLKTSSAERERPGALRE